MSENMKLEDERVKYLEDMTSALELIMKLLETAYPPKDGK